MDDFAELHSRRKLIKLMSAGVLMSTGIFSMYGCSQKEPLLRIASNVWPGYELLYLAREKVYFDRNAIRLVEVASATACIQSLAAGTAEGAMLTLDEVLTARAEGIDLRVIAVLDVSMGADVLLAKPEISDLSGLRGKRIGVEKSAVGAVMLEAILQKANLTPDEVELVYLRVNRHREAFLANKIDALVTFEPVKSQLLNSGAVELFSSADIPGRIIDVLAVSANTIEKNPKSLKKLVQSHFRARAFFFNQPAIASQIISKRLALEPSQVPDSYEGVDLPDVITNIKMLSGSNSEIEQSAKKLAAIMLKAKLITGSVPLEDLVDNRFLHE